MNAGSLEGALRLQKLLIFSIIMLLVLVLGYMLADDAFFAAFAFGGLAWLMLMPYHATLSVVCAVATFSTALILPFFPGRPFIWEAAALLGWTGCVLVFSFRQYRDGMWDSIFEHKWLLLGVAGYCGVLVFTMMERGVGFRTMGGSQMGGRFYFQQLTCAIFPLLFMMVRLKEEQIRKLFIIQCALSATWVISDVIYSNAPGLFNILFFLEVPGDARNFEMERMKMGINRYQSLAFVSIGFLWLLLIKNKLNDFLTTKGVWLIPASLVIVGAGLLSGHRYTVVIILLVLVFMVIAQRLITIRNALTGSLALALGLTISYGFAERMPLAAQRALSVLRRARRGGGAGRPDGRRGARRGGRRRVRAAGPGVRAPAAAGPTPPTRRRRQSPTTTCRRFTTTPTPGPRRRTMRPRRPRRGASATPRQSDGRIYSRRHAARARPRPLRPPTTPRLARRTATHRRRRAPRHRCCRSPSHPPAMSGACCSRPSPTRARPTPAGRAAW